MRYLFLFLLVILSYSGSLEDCYASCQQDYEERVRAAEDMASRGAYFEAVMESNCPRVTTEYYEKGVEGPGEYARCVVYVWKCAASGGEDCTRNAGLQQCCLEEAKVSAQRMLEGCRANCEYKYGEEETEGQSEVVCEQYCIGDELYVPVGSEDGECLYEVIECENGCDAEAAVCLGEGAEEESAEEEAPSVPSRVDVLLSKDVLILSKDADARSVNILVSVRDSKGNPVQGARVKILVEDPQMTGVLGRWDRRSTTKYTDSSGRVSGRLTLPEITSVPRIYWERFPYPLTVKVEVDNEGVHLESESSLTVQSPVPRIKDVRLTPNPARAYDRHTLFVVVEDPDSSGFTYLFRNYGGTWEVDGDTIVHTDRVVGFRAPDPRVNVVWVSPARGLNKDEIVMAREMMSNLKGLSTNLVMTGSEEAAKYAVKRYAEKKAGKWAANMVPILKTGKTLYGLYGNLKSLGEDIGQLTEARSFGEVAYRSIDMTLEGAKATVGVISLFTDEVPVLSSLSGFTQDFIDSLIGTAQAKLNQKALESKISKGQILEDEYAFYIVVKDEDGYQADYFYTFNMEYLGFEE